MKQGSSRLSSPGGFTIVETLIVLAVTGFLFAAIVVTLSGRQATNQFTQAINDVQTRIQQTISEVQSGYYQSSSDFTCTSTGSAPTINAVSPGSVEQGTNANGVNSGCIFLGKVLQFGVRGTDPQIFTAYGIAGYIGATGSTPAAALNSAKPTAIYTTTSNPTAPSTDVANTSLMNGLNVVSLTYNDGGSDIPIGSIGFLMELGSLDSGNIISGTQPVDLVPVINSALNQSNPTEANKIISTNLTVINPKNGVKICFASGGTNQSGLITIGGNGDNLRVDLQIRSNSTCS